MKQITLLCFLLVAAIITNAQTHTITIFSTVDPIGRTDYYSLKKILPDSVISKELIDPRKSLGIKDNYKVLLYLVQNGWHLVNAQFLPTSTIPYYHLSKDIALDDAAYNDYLRKLKDN